MLPLVIIERVYFSMTLDSLHVFCTSSKISFNALCSWMIYGIMQVVSSTILAYQNLITALGVGDEGNWHPGLQIWSLIDFVNKFLERKQSTWRIQS